ncbi:MAG: hypothetical protein JRF33_27595, partial [Deltaproteobacteria bacterium]|nr:hypothetical protein [Deltaproteobacteria bacterium]
VLSLRLIDVQEVKVIRRISQTLVGDEQGLIGSLRAAALGLNLEQKGLSPDISEQLIEKLKIAEKEKTLFISLSPSYEFHLGGKGIGSNDSAFLQLQPAFMDIRLDVEYPIWRWLRLFASLGFGFTLSESERHETILIAQLDDGAGNQIVMFQGAGIYQPYSAMHLPVALGIKAAPERGRFLPYGSLGVGFSWQKYSFDEGQMDIFQEKTGPCLPPFEEPGTGDSEYACLIESVPLQSTTDPSLLGLDVVAAAGVEWLLTQHIGLKVEGRYRFTYTFGSEDDLQIPIEGQLTQADGSSLQTATKYGLLQTRHGLSFSAGLIAFW